MKNKYLYLLVIISILMLQSCGNKQITKEPIGNDIDIKPSELVDDIIISSPSGGGNTGDTNNSSFR